MMIRLQQLSILTLATFFMVTGISFAEGDATNGEKVFKEVGCDRCHKLSSKRKVGPGLKGDTTRHTDAWLTKWLKDPQGTWEENDEETQALRKWTDGREGSKKTKMKIRKLNDTEIADLIAFLKKNDAN